ncbi:hypothetical protein DPEC_G00185530 [Dallia pectoralis]|uniref:Uncharacterized protein n=1 Tax=Dallia pectoralis TaxID=75939 RepID=A0ACC2GBA4_DALPE|nr:hypothetical protein DPEC_G00185530 [Dallia pectoralis]
MEGSTFVEHTLQSPDDPGGQRCAPPTTIIIHHYYKCGYARTGREASSQTSNCIPAGLNLQRAITGRTANAASLEYSRFGKENRLVSWRHVRRFVKCFVLVVCVTVLNTADSPGTSGGCSGHGSLIL